MMEARAADDGNGCGEGSDGGQRRQPMGMDLEVAANNDKQSQRESMMETDELEGSDDKEGKEMKEIGRN